MTGFSDAVDEHLLVLEPIRGLRRMGRELDRYARLDPKVAEARKLLLDRLLSVGDSDDVLGPLLWTGVRDGLKNAGTLSGLQLFLGDGQWMLRTVEEALDTTFTPDALTEVIQRVSGPESAFDQPLDMARQELRTFGAELAEDNPAAVAVVAGVAFVVGAAAGYALVEAYHHHAGH